MGILTKLRDFLRIPAKNVDTDGRPKRIKMTSKTPLVQVKGSVPRSVIPGLRTQLPRRVQVDGEAQLLIDKCRKERAGKIDPPVQMLLGHLYKIETATIAEAKKYAQGSHCRFATVDEFVGYIVTLSAREEAFTQPIVSLDTSSLDDMGTRQPLTDDFGNHLGLVYLNDVKARHAVAYLTFAERIRGDWLLALVHEPVSKAKKGTR